MWVIGYRFREINLTPVFGITLLDAVYGYRRAREPIRTYHRALRHARKA
jgi:hypothetical protein